MTTGPTADSRTFLTARDFLLGVRKDYNTAYREFRWPELTGFNWALDYIDALGADPESAKRPALWIVETDGSQRRWSFAELAARSNRVANWLRGAGVGRDDRKIRRVELRARETESHADADTRPEG